MQRKPKQRNEVAAGCSIRNNKKEGVLAAQKGNLGSLPLKAIIVNKNRIQFRYYF
jgi:hypothetical protein